MKISVTLLIISMILISGCVSTIDPVNPEDVIASINPITIKEFQEQEISVDVFNNATEAIDDVRVASFDTFTVISKGNVNIPAKTKDGASSVTLTARIQAPGFKAAANTTTLTLSYASGKDEKGAPVIRTKTVSVQTTVLPNASLQFVGFVESYEKRGEWTGLNTWTLEKGKNATITFSVKNDGKTTIDKNSLKVVVEIDNKEIGGSDTFIIGEAMAMGGTSYTEAVVLNIKKDAPNGETPVYVKLFMGENLIDSKTLTLKVKLT
ncbi:MAG: DUF1659 domain-containing protein [Euryarchaeota archaeon]|nr:DUF1659 domain-containing protein [Euryarchaeota archaeon]